MLFFPRRVDWILTMNESWAFQMLNIFATYLWRNRHILLLNLIENEYFSFPFFLHVSYKIWFRKFKGQFLLSILDPSPPFPKSPPLFKKFYNELIRNNLSNFCFDILVWIDELRIINCVKKYILKFSFQNWCRLFNTKQFKTVFVI